MDAVCKVSLVVLFVGLIHRPGVVSAAHDSDDDNGPHTFKELKEFLLERKIETLGASIDEAENVTFPDTVKLVSLLLDDRFKCLENLGDDGVCSACAENITIQLYQIVDVDTAFGLSEISFQRASVVLLHLVSREDLFAVCDVTEGQFDRLENYTAALLGSDSSLSEEELDDLLVEIGHTYHPGTRSKCFDVETVFEAEVVDHENGATVDELFHVSPYIIAKLLAGYCIGTPEATDRVSFRDDIFEQFGEDGVMPEEHFEEILELLSIGETDDGHEDEHGHGVEGDHEDEDDHADEHDHDKRDVGSRSTVRRAVNDGHDPTHEEKNNSSAVRNVTTTCFTGEELLDIFSIDHEAGITEEQFSEICPALVQQVVGKACIHHQEEEEELKSDPLVWVYGTISVLIISLASLIGGAFIPCMSTGVYEKTVHSLIALGVSVLTGDAIIHLLPLALGVHGHEGGHEVHSPFDEELAFVWKSLMSVVAIYGFYLLETILGAIAKHDHVHTAELSMVTADAERDRKRESQAELTENMDNMDADVDGKGNCLTRYGAVPIMVIIGDGLHNFADGLAIGAAFTAGIGPGISTSLAVLCHEVPHELGDLAILLKSGLNLKWAMFLNFMSALSAFAGLFIGIPLATTEVARQWIFAVTAGMFLYVALVDMMPQITNLKGLKDPKFTFILQNIFFILGGVFIFLLAVYEDAISVQF